jgi:uncharacterized protein (DUF1015 family)
VATLRPFRALRPTPPDAGAIAAVPYDVVSTDEARALADGNPLSFLRVSRAELELPAGTDPYSPAVYDRAAENFRKLRDTALVVEAERACISIVCAWGRTNRRDSPAAGRSMTTTGARDQKHEKTRRDKEDDRIACHDRAGRADRAGVSDAAPAAAVSTIASRVTSAAPLIDFTAADGVSHTLWKVAGGDRDALVTAFGGVPALHRRRTSSRCQRRAHTGSPQGSGRVIVIHRCRVSRRSGANPFVQPRREESRRADARRV